MMRRVARIGAAAALLGVAAAAAAAKEAPVYAEGQVWEYRTRPGDEGSLLRIGPVEPFPGGPEGRLVYHISLAGVRLPPDGAPGVVQHMPVARETLDASVTRRSEAGGGDFGNVQEGIEEWRRGRGGVFNIAVADIVGLLVDTLANVTPRPLPR